MWRHVAMTHRELEPTEPIRDGMNVNESTTGTMEPVAAGAQPVAAPQGEETNGNQSEEIPADIERIDFSSPEFHEHAFERYEAVRAKCPVSRAMFVGDESAVE